MDYSNRKFVIISSDEVSSVDFSLVLETSADTLRYNNDNTKPKLRQKVKNELIRRQKSGKLNIVTRDTSGNISEFK